MTSIPHAFALPTGILAAIEMHRAAWSLAQVAGDPEEATLARLAQDEALSLLVAMPCRSCAEARQLAAYLRWYVAEETEDRDWSIGTAAAALVRASDLALMLGQAPLPRSEERDTPLAFLVARVMRRLSQAGEVIAAVTLIVGGIAATGLATLL